MYNPALRWLILLFPLGLFAQTTSVINMSRDLVAKGIAQSNLLPNSPSQDARLLFEQTIAFASNHGYANVTADPGSYYFLSLHNANEHVLINAVANVTIDWQNSDLYFAHSNTAAIEFLNCTSLTMQNFTLDYSQLPFTQVTVTAVDSVKANLTFQTIPTYQPPSAFNSNRAPDGSDAIYMFVFRNGAPLPVGRLTAARPVTGSVISISNTSDPWTAPSYLSLIQAGDTVVFTDRGGPPAINFVGGQKCAIHNASIYSSGQIGLYFGRTGAATADHVQVIPRPGTSRLISANADGIHISFALSNNTLTNNIVRRACDDALAIAAEWIATAQGSTGSTVVVSRSNASPFPVGSGISFVDNTDASIIGTATITAESPLYSQQTFTDGEKVTLSLSGAITGIPVGAGVVDANPDKRGNNSVIAYNTVQQGVFSRGIWLSGVQNVTVHDNFVQSTSNIGMLVQQLSANLTDTGPSSGITIQNNVVDNALNYGGISAGPIITAASIHVVSENSKNAQVATSPNSVINIEGNRVTNSPRSAIRMENVNVGSVTGNTVQGFGLAPAVNAYVFPSCCESAAQYLSDFMQAVLTTNTVAVTTSTNTTADNSKLIANGSTASYNPRVAVDSLAFAYGANLASSTILASLPFPASLGGVTVMVTDSAGVSKAAPILAVSANQVNYQIPAGLAPGVGSVTIGASAGGVQIDAVSPGLYSANSSSSGVAAASAALYSANGAVTPETLVQCPNGTGSCVSVSMSLGAPTDQLAVSLYGTGLRHLSSLQNAALTVGGVHAQILFIGAQSQIPGLDQVNFVVPRSLAGAGEVPIALTIDGQTANVVTINLK